MLVQDIIPAVKKANATSHLITLEFHVQTLKAAIKEIHHTDDDVEKAKLARTLRLETMIKIREDVDAAEGVVPSDLWTLATYKDLLFLDQTVA